jgi:hypothetical protein
LYVTYFIFVLGSGSLSVRSAFATAADALVLVKSGVFGSRRRWRGPSRSSSKRYRRFRRRKLAYHLVLWCRRHVPVPDLDFRSRQHRRWRRKKSKWKESYRVKRRELRLERFLTPLPTGQSIWNQRRRVDRVFLAAEATPFLPHVDCGVIPDEVLDEFVFDRGPTFLAAPKLFQQFGTISLEEGAELTARRLNLFQSSMGSNCGEVKRRATFKECPLVWDTGASFGLTPF